MSGLPRPSPAEEVLRDGRSIPQIPFHFPTRALAATYLSGFDDVEKEREKLTRRIQELDTSWAAGSAFG